MMSVSSELRELRLGAGFTQQELADMLMVDRKYISRVETGAQVPDAIMWLTWIHTCTDVPLKLDFEHDGKILQPA